MAALVHNTSSEAALERPRLAALPAPAGSRDSSARLTGRRLTAVNLAGDVAGLLVAALLAGGGVALALVPAALAALAARGLYADRRPALLDGARSVTTALTTGCALGLLGVAALAPAAADPRAAARAWMLALLLVGAQRLGVGLVRRADAVVLPTVIVAPGARGAELDRALRNEPTAGFAPMGLIDAHVLADGHPGDVADVARLARESGARHVILSGAAGSDEAIGALARACAELGLGVSLDTAASRAGAALAVEHVGPLTLVSLRPAPQTSPELRAKHALDRVAAGLLLVALAPVLGVVGLAVRLSSPGPVLFRQRRVGRDGREFEMLKFRSMRTAAPAASRASLRIPAGVAPGGVEGDDRRTWIGALLRRSSLDELPQLANVLRGEMSIVGPRPERPEYVDRFAREIDRYDERHRLRSGMTGLSQVNGLRGKTSLRDRVAYDNHYVEQWSLWLDAKIVLRTVMAVLRPAE